MSSSEQGRQLTVPLLWTMIRVFSASFRLDHLTAGTVISHHTVHAVT